MTYRHFMLADRIPPELEIGFEQKTLTPDLTWVAVDGMKVVGVLMGFAAHGMFFPFRICVANGAPRHCALILLRKAFREMRSRGYSMYLVMFMNESSSERRLLGILESRGETVSWDGDSVLIGGNISDLLSVPHREPSKLKVANG